MADIVSTKILSENVREVVYQFNYQYVDTGNESAVVKIDASSLQPNSNGDPCTGLKILETDFMSIVFTKNAFGIFSKVFHAEIQIP